MRNIGAPRRRCLGRLRQVLHRDLDRRLARERHGAGEQLVEDDPRRVEVGALVDRGAARLLGREVLRRTHDRPGLGHLARACAGDPEVGDLHPALAVDEHVVRLDVPVDDPVLVRVPERGEDLARVRDRDRNRARPPGHDELLEGAALDVLHHDVVRARRNAPVVDRDDVRVGEAGGVRRLAAEALDELLVVRVALVKHLHGDVASELLILGQPDVGHPTGAELALQPVAVCEECPCDVVACHGCRTLRIRRRGQECLHDLPRNWCSRCATGE